MLGKRNFDFLLLMIRSCVKIGSGFLYSFFSISKFINAKSFGHKCLDEQIFLFKKLVFKFCSF